MRAVELFAGVGGFRLGLERNNIEVVWANEWDKYAADIYDKNFGGKINRESITDVRAEDIPAHDLICGGFPCQAFSIAGKRKGFDETRGTLFFDIMRIAQHHRTPYLFLENVKGLLNHDGGRTFETIIRTMDELGYDCQWQVLNSKNFGVPQNRERVFIIGHLRGQPRPEVFPIGQNGSKDNSFQQVKGEIAQTLVSTYSRNQSDGQYVIQRLDIDAPHYQDRVYSPEGLAPTLPTGSGGNHQPFVAMQWRRSEKGKQARKESQKEGRDYTPFSGDHRELIPKDGKPVGALTAQAIAKDSLLGTHSGLIRRLTPLECERLQGFPDGWTEGVSDTQRYKMMGNAVTVNVIEVIATQLKNLQTAKMV